jgi:hypothetical protein
MVLALSVNTPGIVRGTGNPNVTGSFTPDANALIAVLAGADESTTFGITNTGGIAFGTALDTLSVAGRGSLASWVGFAGSSPSAMTISCTQTGSFTANLLRVLVFTGAESSFTGAHGVAQSNTITKVGTAAGSWFWAVCLDELGTTTDAAGTGCSWHDAETAFGGISGGSLKRTTADGTNGGNTTMAFGSASANMSIIALEIKPAAASTASGPIYPMSQYGSFR